MTLDDLKTEAIGLVRGMVLPHYCAGPEVLNDVRETWIRCRTNSNGMMITDAMIDADLDARLAKWRMWHSCIDRVVEDITACESVYDLHQYGVRLVAKSTIMKVSDCCVAHECYRDASWAIRETIYRSHPPHDFLR